MYYYVLSIRSYITQTQRLIKINDQPFVRQSSDKPEKTHFLPDLWEAN